MGWSNALRRLTGRPARWQPLPTADYYLLGAIGDLIAENGIASARHPIVQVGPNTWNVADRMVIVRYATAQELAWIEARRWRSIHYIIDDLLPAAHDSPELPDDYRAKLARFSATLLPRILALRPTIVAPSAAILALFPGLEHRRLDPCCLALSDRVIGDLAISDSARLPPPPSWLGSSGLGSSGLGPIEIVFLGTRSHAGTLPLLAAIAARLELACPQARLHVFFGRHLPQALARRAGIVNHAPIAWPQFQAFCRQTQFHIGLAPIQDTAFAKARSITKIMDHAAVGAIGIYSNRAPFSSVITHGQDGLLVGDGAEAWTAAVLELAASPQRADSMAAGGARLAADRGDRRKMRAFWLQELGLNGLASGDGGHRQAY